MQYETVAKDDVDYVLHYVLDYVLCTLFSPKYEILGVRINDKDLSAKSRLMLCVSSPEWDNQGKHFNFRWICLTNFVFRFREILWCTCYVMLCYVVNLFMRHEGFSLWLSENSGVNIKLIPTVILLAYRHYTVAMYDFHIWSSSTKYGSSQR